MIIRGRHLMIPYTSGRYNPESDTFTIRIDCEKFLETWIEITLTHEELTAIMNKEPFSGKSELNEIGFVPLKFGDE